MDHSFSALAVLIVEDEACIRRGFERWLRDDGAVVEGTSTAKQAQQLLATRPWDVLIVDRRLPDGDGFDAILFRSHDSIGPRTACLAISAYFDAETLLRLQGIGAVVLPKLEVLERQILTAAIELALYRASSWPYAAGEPDAGTIQPPSFPDLTAGEAAILGYLTSLRGRWASTCELAQNALGRADSSAQILVRQYVHRLRKKTSGSLIEHARRHGYRVRDVNVQ